MNTRRCDAYEVALVHEYENARGEKYCEQASTFEGDDGDGMKKTISYYVRETYGVLREYVVNPDDAAILRGLTGRDTVDGRIRELVRDLTGGLVTFKLVHWPLRGDA